jgi:hypothetical protein
MKRQFSLQHVLIITALLFSQFSNAFALSPYSQVFGMPQMQAQMQDCDMGMTLKDKHSMPSSSEHMSASKGERTYTGIATDTTMDCCDDPSAIVCCDTECQCSSVIAPVFIVSQLRHTHQNVKNHDAIVLYIINPTQPFLHQPKRPPIRTFS